MNLDSLPILLAQARAKQPRPGDWSFGWGTVGLIAAAAAGIVLVIWCVKAWLRYREQRTTHSPWLLFQELCAAHGLTYAERRIAKQLAKELRLAQPGVLFVESAWWESDRLPRSLTSQLVTLEKLRKRLFAPR